MRRWRWASRSRSAARSPAGTRWTVRLLRGGELEGAALRDTYLGACEVAFVDYRAELDGVLFLDAVPAQKDRSTS